MVKRLRRHRLAAATLLGVGAASLFLGPATWAMGNSIEAKSETIVPHFTAYGEVVPISVTSLRASDTGVVRSLVAFPGQAVRAGQKLARLQGPEISSQLTQLRARVRGDRAELRSARQALATELQKFSLHLATRKAVYDARAVVSSAMAGLDSSESALHAARSAVSVVAPIDGVVSSLDVSNGERVQPGQVLLTLQSQKRLWLRALYYGTRRRSLRVGLRGQFLAADGGQPISVVVVSVGPVVEKDGALPVRLRPESPDVQWQNGDVGRVRLNGRARRIVVVPTRALILERGRWWVLRKTPNGERRQQVTIGASHGFDTEIDDGLKPGDRVVVTDAYLDFHRAFSQYYQPPD